MLQGNMKVTVTIDRNAVMAADGGTNTAIQRRTFLTVASPIYASVDYIILSAGEYLDGIPEAAVYAMSFAASTLADDYLLFDVGTFFADSKHSNQWKFFRRARTEFVKCKVVLDSLRAVVASKGTSFGRKLLADFSIDNANLAGIMQSSKPIIQDWTKQVEYWRKALFAGGNVDFEFPMMKTAVKAGYHSDNFGGIGRSWEIGRAHV